MYEIHFTTKSKKDLKKYKKELDSIFDIIQILAHHGRKGIPRSMWPHQLSGNYRDYWECHIKPDLLMIWKEDTSNRKLTIVRIGSHSSLFK